MYIVGAKRKSRGEGEEGQAGWEFWPCLSVTDEGRRLYLGSLDLASDGLATGSERVDADTPRGLMLGCRDGDLP